MATFRDREKKRLEPLAASVFGPGASQPGLYKGVRRPFCIDEAHSSLNLHESLREEALAYFQRRDIKWHDGLDRRTRPSNHMCCSQSACVNAWFPFQQQPTALTSVLTGLGYPVSEVLPFAPDTGGRDHEDGAVAFEWIGLRNYLSETTRGHVASDNGRSRGAGFTSADFAFRFRRTDNRVQVLLGEWKYTEAYGSKSLRFSDSGTDRLDIYGPFLALADCPIQLGNIDTDALFVDPFDQLMRLQLLAREMERAHELGADLVTVLHVAPRANTELASVTSEGLEPLGESPHDVWLALVGDDRFRGVTMEELLPILVSPGTLPTSWCEWMTRRYGGMA